MNALPIHKVRKGELVKRKASAKKVYVRGEYDRAIRKFSLVDFEDHCREIFVARTATVIVDFEF